MVLQYLKYSAECKYNDNKVVVECSRHIKCKVLTICDGYIQCL